MTNDDDDLGGELQDAGMLARYQLSGINEGFKEVLMEKFTLTEGQFNDIIPLDDQEVVLNRMQLVNQGGLNLDAFESDDHEIFGFTRKELSDDIAEAKLIVMPYVLKLLHIPMEQIVSEAKDFGVKPEEYTATIFELVELDW